MKRFLRRAGLLMKLNYILVRTLGLACARVAADEEITQYRYRSFDPNDPTPPWVSGFVSGTVLPGITKVNRGGANDAFQQFWYANFDGTRRYVCEDDVPGNDLSQDFSVTAWLNLNSLAGVQTICSTIDAANQTGFRLFLESGRLIGEAWFDTSSGKSSLAVAAPEVLAMGKWYRLAFRRFKNAESTVHFMDLWVDSTMVARVDLPTADLIDNSTLNPVFGADRASTGFNTYLNAKVYGIQVDDYALSAFFLSSPLIRDGSRYFGMPSYHDYIGEGADNRPLERRIDDTHSTNVLLTDFRARLADRWIFPFANDDYIPQGIAADQANRRLFISMYYKDANGENPGADGNPCTADDVFPSIVAEVLMPEGRLGNTFVLKDTNGTPLDSHVGGIAYLDGLLIVPDAKRLLVYDISLIPASTFDPDTFANFNPREIIPVRTFSNLVPWDSIAFIDLHFDENHQRWLLLGDYAGGQEINYLCRLDYTRAIPPIITLGAFQPMQQLTDYMQGAATYYDAGGVMRSFQAGTGGLTSRILTALYPDKHETPIANPSAIAPTLRVPRGLEQLCLYDHKLWTISESGARHLQKRIEGTLPCNETEPLSRAWRECYPFLYSLQVEDRLDTNTNRLSDQWEATYALPATTNPDLDPDLDGFTTWQEYVADTDPTSQTDYPVIRISRSPREVSFYTSLLRFYTLQTSTDLQVWTNTPRFRGLDRLATFPGSFAAASEFYRVRIEDK